MDCISPSIQVSWDSKGTVTHFPVCKSKWTNSITLKCVSSCLLTLAQNYSITLSFKCLQCGNEQITSSSVRTYWNVCVYSVAKCISVPFLKHLYSYSVFFITIWPCLPQQLTGSRSGKKILFLQKLYPIMSKNPTRNFCLNFIVISNYSCSSEVLFKFADLSSFTNHESSLSLVFSAPSGINIPFFPGVTNLTLLFRLCTFPLFHFCHLWAALCAHFLPSAVPLQHPHLPSSSENLSCEKLVAAGNTEMKDKIIFNS